MSYCKYCGEFISQNLDRTRMYCSGRCRTAAYRNRQNVKDNDQAQKCDTAPGAMSRADAVAKRIIFYCFDAARCGDAYAYKLFKDEYFFFDGGEIEYGSLLERALSA